MSRRRPRKARDEAAPAPTGLMLDVKPHPAWPPVVLALAVIAVGLSLARPVAAPLTLAAVTAMVISPVQRRFCALGMHASLASALTIVVGVLMSAGLALAFRPWVAEVIERAPQIGFEVQRVLAGVRADLAGLFDLQEEVMKALDPDAGQAGPGGEAAPSDLPSLADAAAIAPQVLGQIVIFFGGLFFFLFGKEQLYASIETQFAPRGPRINDFHAAERQVARYFGAITLVNFGFGTLVALVLGLIGLPGAPLWGLIAALANFVLYVGPALVALALGVAGVVAFDGFVSVLPAAVFVALNFTEGQFVTPMFVGHRMRLNPLVVFTALVFWLWLWGPAGGIVAIPLLLWGQAMWRRIRRRSGRDQPPTASASSSASVSAASLSAGSKAAGLKLARKS